MNSEFENLKPQVEAGSARKGKVAHLPDSNRDQINQMILDGSTYPQVIEKTGDLAKVQSTEPPHVVTQDSLTTAKERLHLR